MLNKSQAQISSVLKLLYLVENIEKIFVFLSEAKTYNVFNARAKDLRIYEKLYGFIIERTHCKKPYNKSVKMSAQLEQSIVVCHRGAIAVSYDFSCVYSTRYGSDTNKINYSIFFDQHYLTIPEAIERFEQMLMSVKMEELS